MHTLRPVSPPPTKKKKPGRQPKVEIKYNVVYDDGYENLVVTDQPPPKPEAMQLVNYLNGGLGHKFGEPVTVQNWPMES